VLPVPNLDDRRFQDLVDDAKRLVQQRCPEWTDHNVSDPGVTLIEAFATMVEALLYRLNRVPDAHYLRFLDLIGVRLHPPTAARCDLTFWLAAPREDAVTVPADTEVATPRTGTDEPVVFSTLDDLVIPPCTLERSFTSFASGEPLERGVDVPAFSCFGTPPRPDDALLFGLSDAVPGCAVLLRLDCEVEGVGIDPRDPPLRWEAWTGRGWTACEVDRDTTGGLNRLGDVVLHVPREHVASVIARRRAGWLRCRVVEPEPGQPFYAASPRLKSAQAATIGGSVAAAHAQAVRDEVLGRSEGTPGQRFRLHQAPVVPAAEPFVVEVSSDGGWVPWRAVDTFAYSGPDDRHVVVDAASGEVRFPPVVREEDGTLRRYGAVPDKDATIRVPVYRTGGGRAGNVARGLLRVQREPVPFVSRVENRAAAAGGVAGETVAEAAVRGPLVLRTRDRAVTAEDYEQLAREAAPEVARVRCVPAGDTAGDAAGGSGARVLVVPACPTDEAGRLTFTDLKPGVDTLDRIVAHLDERRCLGARVVVEPPYYQGVTVVARVRARRGVDVSDLTGRAVQALYTYLDPLSGGPDRDGWPFGRPVQAGEVYGALQALHGVDIVEDVRLFGADPVTGERGGATTRLDLPPHALVFSYGHQVRVSAP
jgi:predicted phage baseplate assembly protein